MKKLLSTVLALSMGATCVFGLTACGKKDSETAEKAINTVKSLYSDKGPTIDEDYKLIGQTKVEKSTYTVNWSVSSETFSDLDKYVKVGEMDETTKQVTVSVAKADQAIEYQLTATVKVGKKSASATFDRKVSAKAASHAGTEADPYTPSNVIEIAKGMTPKAKLEESDNPQRVYVQGYIVDCGTDQTPNGYDRVGYVYIVDEYEEGKTSSSPDAVMILSINYGEVLTAYSDLTVGAKITVSGYIMLYLANNSTKDPQPEITYYGSEGVQCVALENNLTDAEKVAKVKANFDLATKTYTATGSVDLPAKSNGATLTWAVKTQTDLVKIENGKLVINSIPTAETEIVLTVTITSGSESDSKDITIKLAPPADLGTANDGTAAHPYTIAEVNKLAEPLSNNEYYKVNGVNQAIHITGYITVLGTWKSDTKRYNDMYIADEASATQAGSLWVYTLSAKDGTPLEKEGDLVVGDKITILGYVQIYNNKVEITFDKVSNEPVTVVSKTSLTPAEKITAALAKVPTEFDVRNSGATPLPESSIKDVTFTWSCTDTTYPVEDGKITVSALPASKVDLTVHVEASCTGATAVGKDMKVTIYAAVTGTTTTVSKTITEVATANTNNWSNGKAYESFALDSVITVASSGTAVGSYEKNTGKYYANISGTDGIGNWRLYQTESAKLTITAATGHTIVSVKVTYSNSNDGALQIGTTEYASGDIVNVNDSSIVFDIIKSSTSTSSGNAQVRVTAIEVIYA